MIKNTINGIEYFRRKKHMSLAELSAASGVAYSLVRELSKEIRYTTSSDVYRRLARALNVTVDDLLLEYSYDDLAVGDRSASRRGDSRCNCIDNYRWAENLPLEELARRMGVTSRERARQICNMPVPSRKHLLMLAEYENTSLEEFKVRYGVEEMRVCA